MHKLNQRVVFFGTPSFAVPSLQALLDNGWQVPLVVTQPDRPMGRGRKPGVQAVKAFCQSNSNARAMRLIQPQKMKDPMLHQQLEEAAADVFVVVAYGRILPDSILALAHWVLNVHASLLPRWRGAAPIQRCLLAGDTTTGVSIMKIVKRLDAGDVAYQLKTSVDANESSDMLSQRLAVLGASALLQTLKAISADHAEFKAQDENFVTLAPPITVAEARINWQDSVEQVHNCIRAFYPWPGAFTHDGSKRIKMLASRIADQPKSLGQPGTLHIEQGKLYVACRDGWLQAVTLQVEGKTGQAACDFVQGYRTKNISQWL